jgi:hypothetical protein
VKQSKQTSWEEQIEHLIKLKDLHLRNIEDLNFQVKELKQELYLLEQDYYECKEELSKMTVPKELIISIGPREYTYRREE